MSFPLIKLLMRPSGDLFCDCTGSVDVFVGIEMSSLQVYSHILMFYSSTILNIVALLVSMI